MEFTYQDMIAMEAGLDYVYDAAMEAYDYEELYAMEGTNAEAWSARKQAMKEVKATAKEMNAAAKSGDYKTAAEKARECARRFDALKQTIEGLKQSASSAILVDLALALASIVAIAAAAFGAAKLGKAIGKKRGAKAGSKRASEYLASEKGQARGAAHGKRAMNAAERRLQLTDAEKATRHDLERQVDQLNKSIISTPNEFKNLKNDTIKRKNGLVDQLNKMRANPTDKQIAEARRGAKATAATRRSTRITEHLVKAGTEHGGKVGAKAGAMAGGAVASTAVGAFLAKKGLLGGNKGKKLGPNDMNALIGMCKKTCDDGKRKYTQLAQMYEHMANAE